MAVDFSMPEKGVTAPAVYTNGRVHLVNEDGYRAAVGKAGWADGEALVVRVETEADAAMWHHYKFFYGYVVDPMVRQTGDVDWAFQLKAMFLKEPYTSLTEQTADEFAEFNARCDAYCRLAMPEAFENHGREWLGPGQGCIRRTPERAA